MVLLLDAHANHCGNAWVELVSVVSAPVPATSETEAASVRPDGQWRHYLAALSGCRAPTCVPACGRMPSDGPVLRLGTSRVPQRLWIAPGTPFSLPAAQVVLLPGLPPLQLAA
ncbi:hypothetical protein GCM10027195_43460 [Comamonas sediminis]